MKIWNLVGEEACKLFERDGIQMQFQAAVETRKLLKDTHYVLLLDESDSMKGDRWDSLMKAVKGFMQKLITNVNIKQHSKVTLVTYDWYDPQVRFSQKSPDASLTDGIEPYYGWGTRFNKAMNTAYDECAKNSDRYDRIVLFFMTDGESAYPEEEVTKFKNDSSLMKNLEFHAVGFSDDSEANFEVLEKMAKEMSGDFAKSVDEKTL